MMMMIGLNPGPRARTVKPEFVIVKRLVCVTTLGDAVQPAFAPRSSAPAVCAVQQLPGTEPPHLVKATCFLISHGTRSNSDTMLASCSVTVLVSHLEWREEGGHGRVRAAQGVGGWVGIDDWQLVTFF